jgi:hypothetical protein
VGIAKQVFFRKLFSRALQSNFDAHVGPDAGMEMPSSGRPGATPAAACFELAGSQLPSSHNPSLFCDQRDAAGGR